MKQSELAEALKIDKFDLDNELVQQPILYWQASEAATLARSRLDQAKADLDLLEAELYRSLREEYSKDKPSEKTLSMILQSHSDFVAERRRYLDLKLRSDKWDNLKDAFGKRGYILRELVEMYITGYYQKSSMEGAQNRSRDARANYNQERMARKRLARNEV